MKKHIDTGVMTCDLCNKIAVEVLASGSMCEQHAEDPRYYFLKQQNIKLKNLLSKFLTYGTAKSGFEEDFKKISSIASSALWDT